MEREAIIRVIDLGRVLTLISESTEHRTKEVNRTANCSPDIETITLRIECEMEQLEEDEDLALAIMAHIHL